MNGNIGVSVEKYKLWNKNQMDILELKNTTSEIKNSLDRLNSVVDREVGQ